MTQSFIEKQFPISKLSKESYKERKSNLGQTLTGMGKWWGRKPLILVRAIILGLLMPSSDDLKKDKEIFLKILTMDKNGLLLRKNKTIPILDVYANIDEYSKNNFFEIDEKGKPIYKKGISQDEKNQIQQQAFLNLSYDNKLKYCLRPEEVKLTDPNEWKIINNHLGTTASSLEELIQELGIKKFGNVPKVGDCFAGGGSIPFESSRLGCNTYASDLNPVACILNWANLNILSKSDEDVEKLNKFRQKVYDEVEKQIVEWGVEHNELEERALSYIYCNESVCPECGYTIPLSPTWTISKKNKVVALLEKNNKLGFDIKIIQNADPIQQKQSKDTITIKNGRMICPHCHMETSISSLRGDKKSNIGKTIYGLRKWESTDIISKETDVFKERLYCIRYEDKNGNKRYITPSDKDIEREQKVLELLSERFDRWQVSGYLPKMQIEYGENTSQLIRERGWTYWHQLFNPRQLLLNGLLYEVGMNLAKTREEQIIILLGINKCSDWNSKLGTWHSGEGVENSQCTFTNQALNTLYNYGCRSFKNLKSSWMYLINNKNFNTLNYVDIKDARTINLMQNIWITDPPYADAVNYHELTEFFLAWDKKLIEKIFPVWYTDSKRALAMAGTGTTFNESMVEIYKNLTKHTTDDGYHVLMYTHQDVKVWAELALVMWLSGLQVVSAWNIATETESGGLKNGGNYVKGTVCLVLKKRVSIDVAFDDEIRDDIEIEVKRQIESMRNLDSGDNPDFTDADYILASYASAIKVLTSYKEIYGINPELELYREKVKGEVSPVEDLINFALEIANKYLIPKGFEENIWKNLSKEEQFFIKCLETETLNDYKISTYQELARGYGVNNYSDMLSNTNANENRVFTASEFGTKIFNQDSKFSKSILRFVLVAIYKARIFDDVIKAKIWLRESLNDDYWNSRQSIISILRYISSFENISNMEHWKKDSHIAMLLMGQIINDGI